MLETLRESQLPLLTLVLLAAGLAKLTLRGEQGAADRAGLAQLLRHNRGAATAVAVSECGLGIALLVVPYQGVRLATAVWFAGATWIVDELKARRPEEGCGCFGALSSTRIGNRVIIRPLLLTAAATATMGVPGTGWSVFGRLAGAPGLVLAAELVLVLALSPEVGVALARRARPSCESRPIPPAETYRTLRQSRAWQEYEPIITAAAPSEVWRELCWRFLVYQGCLGRTEVEVVFAVSLAREKQPVVRVAVVEAVPAAVLEAAQDATVATRVWRDTLEDSGPNPVHAVVGA